WQEQLQLIGKPLEVGIGDVTSLLLLRAVDADPVEADAAPGITVGESLEGRQFLVGQRNPGRPEREDDDFAALAGEIEGAAIGRAQGDLRVLGPGDDGADDDGERQCCPLCQLTRRCCHLSLPLAPQSFPRAAIAPAGRGAPSPAIPPLSSEVSNSSSTPSEVISGSSVTAVLIEFEIRQFSPAFSRSLAARSASCSWRMTSFGQS